MEIRAADQLTREPYGPERLKEDLAENGVNISVHSIKCIRRKLGVRCKQKRKFKATTNSDHAMPVAQNLLEQKFKATAPNQIWDDQAIILRRVFRNVLLCKGIRRRNPQYIHLNVRCRTVAYWYLAP